MEHRTHALPSSRFPLARQVSIVGLLLGLSVGCGGTPDRDDSASDACPDGTVPSSVAGWTLHGCERHREFLRAGYERDSERTLIEIAWRDGEAPSAWSTGRYRLMPAPGETPPSELLTALMEHIRGATDVLATAIPGPLPNEARRPDGPETPEGQRESEPEGEGSNGEASAPTGEPESAPTGEPESAPTGEPESAPTGEAESAPTGEAEDEPTPEAPAGEPEASEAASGMAPSESPSAPSE